MLLSATMIPRQRIILRTTTTMYLLKPTPLTPPETISARMIFPREFMPAYMKYEPGTLKYQGVHHRIPHGQKPLVNNLTLSGQLLYTRLLFQTKYFGDVVEVEEDGGHQGRRTVYSREYSDEYSDEHSDD